MARALLDGRVLGALLHVHLPAVGLHVEMLSSAGGDETLICGIVATPWLLPLFVNVLPDECTLQLWDALLSSRSRAPLFCAALALLQPCQERLLATPELGAAVQLMQGLGAELRQAGTDDVAAWQRRFAAYCVQLDQAELDAVVGRELAERGPVEGLARTPDCTPLSDTGELLRAAPGSELRSAPLLRLKLGAQLAAPAEEGGAGPLQPELAALQALEAGQGGVGVLSAEEVIRLSRLLADLDGQLGALPALQAELVRACSAAVAFPLGVLARSKLPRALAEFEQAYGAWDAGVAQQLGAAKLSGVDSSKATFWEAWASGQTEALLRKGEELQKTLEQAADEWKEVLIAVHTPEVTSASGRLSARESIAVGAKAEAPVAAAMETHLSRVQEDLAHIRSALASFAQDAKVDLPLLAANGQALTAWLTRRAQQAQDGSFQWAAAAERRRAASAQSMAADVAAAQQAAGEALRAAAAKPPGEALGFDAERAHLEAYAAALKAGQDAVAARAKRLARESAALASLRERAEARAAADTARVKAAAAAAACGGQYLARLADESLPASAEAVISGVAALAAAVGEVWRAKLKGYALFMEEATVGLCMNTVTLVNRAEEELAALAEQMGAALKVAAEREAARPNYRKEFSAMAKGLGAALAGGEQANAPPQLQQAQGGASAPAAGRGGGLFSGLGFGRKDTAPPATPAPGAAPQADLLNLESSPADPSPPKKALPPLPGGTAGAEEEAAPAPGEPRKKSKAERALEAELQQVEQRCGRLKEMKAELSHKTMAYTSA